MVVVVVVVRSGGGGGGGSGEVGLEGVQAQRRFMRGGRG